MKKIHILLSATLLVGALHLHGQTIVATDEMLATGHYTKTSGHNTATNRDSDGNHGLNAQVGSHYMRFGASSTSAKNFSSVLNTGFVSEHLIQAGVYTASIDLGASGTILDRDPFETFAFRLVVLEEDLTNFIATREYTEIGDRTDIALYEKPAPGQWTTVTVSYIVEPGSPVIGSVLTWAADMTFASGIADFGAFDNVVVSYVPEPSTYAAIFGGLVLALALIRRRLR